MRERFTEHLISCVPYLIVYGDELPVNNKWWIIVTHLFCCSHIQLGARVWRYHFVVHIICHFQLIEKLNNSTDVFWNRSWLVAESFWRHSLLTSSVEKFSFPEVISCNIFSTARQYRAESWRWTNIFEQWRGKKAVGEHCTEPRCQLHSKRWRSKELQQKKI